ncbi:ATP-binding protein [Sphingobacterium oryzagri]|uniref:ATP-binding protein n=1 Tax=Sphingobacterium oryzagri TaxID=3025669 RepID=A0ABY7WKR8_9SPHI|nr:ATP-binding protein [Sphingobacterium sp. KACC 22765]WDF69222.1 ATP-binding protein [Sphingobacterium sp. KACC 22765]
MAAAEQIKSLIKSYGNGDDTRFYATAMQIAASEAKKGHLALADEIKKLIDSAKAGKSKVTGIVKPLYEGGTQKELNDLLELVHPEVKLSNMILSSKTRKSLSKILNEQAKTELLRHHNLLPRKKLLFTGPPGSGKTMSASALASELGIPLFIIRLDGLISKYMGESIAKLRLIFNTMHKFRAIYLFDEFDSIGTTRTSVNEVGEIKRVLNSFLLQIEKDDSNSLIIAATNLPEFLDPALFRRFDDIIVYTLPEPPEIRELYSKRLNELNLCENFNLDRITKESIGLSYSDISRICEDLAKDVLVYGMDEISEDSFCESISHRRKPF